MIPERNNEQDVFGQLKAIQRAEGKSGSDIDRLWHYYLGAKPHQQAKLLQRLRVTAAILQDKHIGNRRIYLEPPPPELIGRGDYEIGRVIYPGTTPYPVRVYKEELLQHVFGVGKAGSGKTTFVMNIIEQAQADNIPWLALDWKGSFRVMMRATNGNNVLVLTIDNDTAPLRVNLLLPPTGVATAAWVENIADTICSSHLLMDGARSKLISVFFRAIKEHGDQATLRDAFTILKNDFAGTETWRRRGQGWMESTERAFEQLTYGTFGDCINERHNPMLISDLLQRNVALELSGLGQAQGATISTFFLQATMLLRQKQRGPREVLRHITIIDEAHNTFRKEATWEKLTLPSKMIRQVREAGECVIAATQQTDVSNSLLANTGTKFVGSINDKWDLEYFSKSFQVDPYYLSIIPDGHGIGVIPKRWKLPFLFAFKENNLKNLDVTDDEVRARYDEYRNGITTSPPTNEPDHVTISENELTLLRSIATQPLFSITQHYDAIDFRPKTGNTAKDRLVRSGLIELEAVQYGNIGKKFPRLTQQGVAIAIDKGIEIVNMGGRSAEHEYWKHNIKQRCEDQGYTVTAEHSIGDRRHVDLYATKADRSFIIEVETGKSDVLTNISKCHNHPATLILFFTNTSAFRTHQRFIPEHLLTLTPTTVDLLPGILNNTTN